MAVSKKKNLREVLQTVAVNANQAALILKQMSADDFSDVKPEILEAFTHINALAGQLGRLTRVEK